MNIYFHELRSYRKNTIIWVLSVGAATVMFLSMFTIYYESAGELVRLFQAFPDAILKAFGMDVAKIATLPGFYSFILGFLVLCGAIQAMNLGISALGREATGKTADFLLTKPVTRTQVITAKLLAVLTHLAVSSAVFLLVASASAFSVSAGGFDYGTFLMMTLSFFYVQLIFAALGFLVSVIVPKIKSVLPVSLSTVFGFYIVGMVGAALNDDRIYYLSPFKYFDPAYIAQYSAYQPQYAAVGAAVVILAVAAGYLIYKNKDIHAV
ncbi:MAG: ABC transporter permease subunit [Candidatus Aminicenantes bacterium]|nr:ABC transporter permease subunit [Candidatus Aminicenantes bacterium]